MAERIKVIWICSVSNQMLRSHLDLGLPYWHRFVKKVFNKKDEPAAIDYAVWNSNALEEFDKIEDIDLHVIFVHPDMSKKEQRFKSGRINYYAVNAGDASLLRFFKTHIRGKNISYKSTWTHIASIVNEVKPDIVHLMGAENPPYSLSVLKLPTTIPLIVQLQTLLHDPSTAIANEVLPDQRICEYKVLQRANYIGSKSILYPQYVRKYIKEDAVFINTQLIIAEKINQGQCEKKFDFVFFANYIQKSIDLAIEAFGVAYQENPNLTLDVVGGVGDLELLELNARLEKMGCKEAVTFEGRLPTHDDVILQIKKARYALLPLKADLVSSTVREAMWAGLPVITTITQGTPNLNKTRETVLLSEIGDHRALADNMLRVIKDSSLAARLQSNAYITVEELYGNNEGRAKVWVEAYRACIDNFYKGDSLPDAIQNKN